MTKSKKSSSSVSKINPQVSNAMKSILTAVTKKPKFYTRATICGAIKTIDPKVVRQARHKLWENKQIRKANGKYILVSAQKKASK